MLFRVVRNSAHREPMRRRAALRPPNVFGWRRKPLAGSASRSVCKKSEETTTRWGPIFPNVVMSFSILSTNGRFL